MNKLAISGALAALIAIPALSIEAYKNEEKDASVNIYGSLKGFVGSGGILSANPANNGSYIVGLQNNSSFGIDTKYGKFGAKVEFGVKEGGVLGSANSPGLRQAFGSYHFGKGGKLSFGKINTITTEGGFQTDFNNGDAGGNGFGSVATGSQKLQIQYSNLDVTLAIIHDNGANNDSGTLATGNAYTSAGHSRVPRFALSYEGKIGEKGKFKVGLTYKYFDKNKIDIALTPNSCDIHAGHLIAGAKVPFGNAYLSSIFTYGINGHLYGEQQTSASAGGYGYTNLSNNNALFLNSQRAGILLESGTKINDTLGVAVVAGYQATFMA